MSHKPTLRIDDLSPAGLARHLVTLGCLATDSEGISAESPGEGNMNITLRVRTPRSSLIVKQAPPWVAKFPSIPAPPERAAHEAAFYRAVQTVPALSAVMPALRAFDPGNALLVFEDLGNAQSGADCYGGGLRFTETDFAVLANFLSGLRTLRATPASNFANNAMRRLNHEHIFDLPLRVDNGLEGRLEEITPGLAHEAATLRTDIAFAERVHALGRRYLGAQSGTLLHGDFFPGSLLRLPNGSWRVIDPEFCFLGDPEFDPGVFFAHLLLSGHDRALADAWLNALAPGLDLTLARQFAGVEIMRRILGVAQLPIPTDLPMKHHLLQTSRDLVLGDT